MKEKDDRLVKNHQIIEKSYPSSQQVNGLVDTTKRRHIDSLTTDSSLGTDTGRIFSWTSVLNSINQDLDRVLISQKMDDFKGVLDNANSHDLLSVVSTVHHERVGKAFDDWAL